MIRTIFILLFSIVVVPLVSVLFGESLTNQQVDILKTSALIALGIALVCFALSELTNNYSQTDKIWSIAPVIYGWYIAYAGEWNERAVLMAVLITIWGVRLTYNFGRRGGYNWKFWTGEEDYRWEVLRNNDIFKGRKWRWKFFNLFFISLYQNGLIYLIVVPCIAVLSNSKNPLGIWDVLLSFALLGFVIIEFIADKQQFVFQAKKHEILISGKPLPEPYVTGFIKSGFWKYMRHPNYMAEQAVWICIYGFSVVATGDFINWSMVGCLLLLILFNSSADFSEGISAKKYPEYKDYQANVGRFLPKLN